jgi:bis(5'-nucleosyl)-tetraphosphatase (symmetrical)
MRYCRLDGSLEFENKNSPQSLVQSETVPNLIPWFLYPRKQALGVTTVFGHWSTLGYYHSPSAIALDTGCVWGGRLTAIQLDTNKPSVISITCNDYG